jgi:hypothetical protein
MNPALLRLLDFVDDPMSTILPTYPVPLWNQVVAIFVAVAGYLKLRWQLWTPHGSIYLRTTKIKVHFPFLLHSTKTNEIFVAALNLLSHIDCIH